MGAWGVGIYDNDDAADWSTEVSDRGLEAVAAALVVVVGADYVEAPDGACAVAAADVVARLQSGRGEDSPYCEEIVAWVSANPEVPPASVLEMAAAAVDRVKGQDSELAELWSEQPESLAAWLATLADVEERLRSSNTD